MTERRPVLTEAELAAEDYHEKPRPGGPEGPLVPAPEELLDPETTGERSGGSSDAPTATPVEGDATAAVADAAGPGAAAQTDADAGEADLPPGDDVVPGEDR
ncbi:hypothetical protein GCM10011512_00490 [Tersicoccus solisilvae]|uniref:Multidrug transporter n=1 Tax=Tersicoccus solisilvae TaxID=1882339 RepID=A0ABQ1NKS1_9MICC|nr:hypothetical protein [Tersicoccus solisilvae]GGC77834.1 hypothetical protein GCM10011512_00490 [Tersicoccus solisilvae]